MTNRLPLFWQCVCGPKLYQTYPAQLPSKQQSDHLYVRNIAEIVSDGVLFCLKTITGILRVIWPLCLFHLHRRGLLTYENGLSLFGHIVCLTIIAIYFMLVRGFSRLINPAYKTFAGELLHVKASPTSEKRQKLLSKFDFSLSHWKPDYVAHSSAVCQVPTRSSARTASTLLERLLQCPMLFVAYICAHVVGRRLMFPGSLQIIRYIRQRELLDGRANLLVGHHAKRCLLRTADGNRIDTVLLDRRTSAMGGMLVVTCEGNAGFYEVACMLTAVHAGYSVFGWNRPGFGESSGSPSVLGEINAIDTVMHYVIDELHVPLDCIIIYAWSIGGYAACWAAMHYRDLRGLVLDAIFDDVQPLAQRQMPLLTSSLVERTIRSYFDLNNLLLLELYNGPFYLIRRTRDEVMNLLPNQPETNRANVVLLHILPYRYPFIYKNDDDTIALLQRYLYSRGEQRRVLADVYRLDDLQIPTNEYRLEHPIASYPCSFGESFSLEQRKCFAIYLADQYLVIFHSSHCTPLPQRYFFVPHRCV